MQEAAASDTNPDMRSKAGRQRHIGGERRALDHQRNREAAEKPHQHGTGQAADERQRRRPPGEQRSHQACSRDAKHKLDQRHAASFEAEAQGPEQIDHTAGRQQQRNAQRRDPLVTGNDDGRSKRNAAPRQHRAAADQLAGELKERRSGKLADAQGHCCVAERERIAEIGRDQLEPQR